MRYIIDSKDNEGAIGAQIAKWQKEGKVEVIEKADPVVEVKAQLERVQRAIEVLKKSGWNSEVMEIYVSRKTGIGITKVQDIFASQREFFRSIGVKV